MNHCLESYFLSVWQEPYSDLVVTNNEDRVSTRQVYRIHYVFDNLQKTINLKSLATFIDETWVKS